MTHLKLAALDAEDLAVISSQVQDAVVKVGNIHWLKTESKLIIEMNRFAWEEAIKQQRRFLAPKPSYERHQAILHFSRVIDVQGRNIRKDAPDAVLNLLAMQFEPDGEGPNGTITLIFAGNAEIRFNVECIEAQLADTGAAWETEHLPEHEAAETFEKEAELRSGQ